MQKSLSLIIIVILISCEKQFVRYPTSSIVKSTKRTGTTKRRSSCCAYNCNSYRYFNEKKRLYSTQRHLFYFVGLVAFFILIYCWDFLSFMRFVDLYNLASKMSFLKKIVGSFFN